MKAEEAITNIMLIYRDYLEHIAATEVEDAAIAKAIIALNYYKEHKEDVGNENDQKRT